ncbi:hypothetical protein OMK68_25410, partial [Rhodococcus pyridinivorans]|nr:hypothetical protein [Rhodococcus pyridinivorans]
MVTDRFREQAEEHGSDSCENPIPKVRPEIEQSWRRCLALGVTPDSSPLRYIDTPTDSKLVRAARPVLDRLADQLADAPVTILLASQDAT